MCPAGIAIEFSFSERVITDYAVESDFSRSICINERRKT